ncbi:MAG: glycosyltransferase [Anaerolineales bacterium]|nr:glycosyltransferase [Anaerolineales bacterium]
MKVSIILPIRNEAAHIEQSLLAILSQDYPADQIEILIVDGMSTDDTRSIIKGIAARHPNRQIQVLDNHGKIVPTGMNIALRQAKGEIVIRVDGHCVIAPDYARNCVEHILSDKADGVGGSIETIGGTKIAKAIAIGMSSPFGVGNSAFRTTVNKNQFVDTAPFPAYTRQIIERAGFYDEELIRNQDDEYSYRIRELGGKILLAANVRSVYFSRTSLRSLWRQYYQYGFWKVRVLQKHPRQMSLRQFVPPAFALALSASVLLALIPVARPLAVIIPLLYLFANLLASFYTAAKRGWKYAPTLPLVFAILHLSYGFGFLVGFLKFWNRWRDKIGKTPAWQTETTGDVARLKREYADRKLRFADKDIYTWFNQANLFAIHQRQRFVLKALQSKGFTDLSRLKILEMGCGDGGVLTEFLNFGAPPRNLYGIDLLADRLSHACAQLQTSHLANADGQNIPFAAQSFDLVLQYTALSSILDSQIRKGVAEEMLRVLKNNGAVLWYDFWLNPTNRQTRGIKPAEIRGLFPNCDFEFRKITLAPPLARRIVPISWGAALFLERIKILNSHYLVLISPRQSDVF